MPEYSKYQQKVISRYYDNRDAIALQRAQELVTELYLSEGKKRQKHWESLYDIKQEDTPENNMFFDKAWSDVSDEEIAALATKLASKTGGHVFHTKIDWNNPTPSITIKI